MSSDKDTLLSMGFDPARVEWALKATSNRGLQPAMDHILENDGKSVPSLADVSNGGDSSNPVAVAEDDEDAEALKAVYGAAGVAGAAADVEAKSIKCSECGKVFRNPALANYHAEKSGHDQFEESTEEIKPLTEEEKKQKLEELREKMAAKRAQKAQQEAIENNANSALRRKAGKDVAAVREEMKAKEAIKEAEQRRRDKIADAKAKAAVKVQIEADKRERAEKAAREKASRQGLQPAQPAQASPPAAAVTASAGTSSKDHKETRLQIRMASGGQPFTTTLPSESTLRDVAEFVAGQTLLVDADTISFAQHFPRKQFNQADFSKTLKELGLTPSAVLIAS